MYTDRRFVLKIRSKLLPIQIRFIFFEKIFEVKYLIYLCNIFIYPGPIALSMCWIPDAQTWPWHGLSIGIMIDLISFIIVQEDE